jgi:hypothetical protein
MANPKEQDENEERINEYSTEYECPEDVFAPDDPPFDPVIQPLSTRYDKDMLVVMPVNPQRVFCYWEISDTTLNTFKAFVREVEFLSCRLELQLYLIDRKTLKIPKKPIWYQNVEGAGQSCNWYVNFDAPVNYENPMETFYAELGYRCADGVFHALLRNKVLLKEQEPTEKKPMGTKEMLTAIEPETQPEKPVETTVVHEKVKPEPQRFLPRIDIDEAVSAILSVEYTEIFNEPEEIIRAYIAKKKEELLRPPEEEPGGLSEASGSGHIGK